jgi:hypothetical protein
MQLAVSSQQSALSSQPRRKPTSKAFHRKGRRDAKE